MPRPHATIRQCLPTLVSAAVIFLVSVIAQAQDASEGGEDLLVLSRTICGEQHADTISMSECLDRQNKKANRWLGAIIESYARYAAKEMALQAQRGSAPFDQVEQLRKSQAAFDLYRKESAELVWGSVDGMGGGLESGMAYFELTVARARFLLDICNHPLNSKLTDKVDLTVTDWCWPAR